MERKRHPREPVKGQNDLVDSLISYGFRLAIKECGVLVKPDFYDKNVGVALKHIEDIDVEWSKQDISKLAKEVGGIENLRFAQGYSDLRDFDENGKAAARPITHYTHDCVAIYRRD
jgi:hypothetical protein